MEFAEATYLAYTTTAEDVKELRGLAADTIDKHADELLKKAEIEKVVCSSSGLAYEVLKRGRPVLCGNCRTIGNVKCASCTGYGYRFCHICDSLKTV